MGRAGLRTGVVRPQGGADAGSKTGPSGLHRLSRPAVAPASVMLIAAGGGGTSSGELMIAKVEP